MSWKKNEGKRPVDPEQRVFFWLREEGVPAAGEMPGEPQPAGKLDWKINGEGGDITWWSYGYSEGERGRPPVSTRAEILDTAKQYVTQDRAATHGNEAEDSFGVIAAYWSAHLDVPITASDVCAMMALLKLARIKGNPKHLDSWIDTAGYAALGGEIND